MTTLSEALAMQTLERQIDRASTELRFVNLDFQVHIEAERESIARLEEVRAEYAINPDHLKEGER